MKDELWENTKIDKMFPINVFHNIRKGPHIMRLHWHEHFEVITVKKGEAIFQIGNNRIHAGTGDKLIVNCGELHTAYSAHEELVEFYAIVFHPTLFGNADLHAMDSVLPFTSGKRLFTNVIERSHESFPDIERVVHSIIDEFDNKHHGYELAVKGYCQLLFIWLTRDHTLDIDRERQLNAWRNKANRFKNLLIHLEKNYMDNITVKQAADIVHLSPYHFCATFKKLTGLTFVHFINLLRITEAERLLKHTSISITETAEKVGCGSIHSFNKLFRKHKGYSPSAYRQAYLDKDLPSVHTIVPENEA